MDRKYKKIIDCVFESGKRIKSKAGLLDDIGVIKKYLSEEDLRIERDLKEIVESFGSDHKIFAEEENCKWPNVKNVWAIDPISGTSAFLAGLPHYAIATSHLIDGEVVFSVVYDPSIDELYIAELGRGAWCNDKKIEVADNERGTVRIIANVYHKTLAEENKILEKLTAVEIKVYRNRNSYAVNYCWVAAGRYGGFITKTHDVFPELAGKLFIEEAGGKFTNKDGGDINIEDRCFVGGSLKAYELLKDFFKD